MINEKEVTFRLTVKAYYDGMLDIGELQQEITETLKHDHWDFEIEVENNEKLTMMRWLNEKLNNRPFLLKRKE